MRQVGPVCLSAHLHMHFLPLIKAAAQRELVRKTSPSISVKAGRTRRSGTEEPRGTRASLNAAFLRFVNTDDK